MQAEIKLFKKDSPEHQARMSERAKISRNEELGKLRIEFLNIAQLAQKAARRIEVLERVS